MDTSSLSWFILKPVHVVINGLTTVYTKAVDQWTNVEGETHYYQDYKPPQTARANPTDLYDPSASSDDRTDKTAEREYDEEVLSLDIEENDFLYRIRRNSRIIYVSVLDGGILPSDCRTDSFRILSKLRRCPRWQEEWRSITIRKKPHGIESTPDEFLPHGLDLGQLDLSSTAPFYSLLDLTRASRISDRISRVRHDGRAYILKVARFKHEIPALQQEVSVYSTLSLSGFQLAPKFIGFVYEETKDRTIGFLMEEIVGRYLDIYDLKECMETARHLHESGIIHGDLNRYNFLITDTGAKVFDFEVSVAGGDVDPAAAEEEIKGLESRLKDESGIGKR